MTNARKTSSYVSAFNHIPGRFSVAESIEIIDRVVVAVQKRNLDKPLTYKAEDFAAYGVDVNALAQRLMASPGQIDLGEIEELCFKCFDMKTLNKWLGRRTLSTQHLTTLIGVEFDRYTAPLESGRLARKCRGHQLPCHAAA
jgi:hypothetical protein